MGVYIGLYFLVIFSALADVRYRRLVMILVLFIMAIVGGLRYETGYDWLAYEINFNEINTRINLVDSLFDSSFEPSYFIFSYVVKSLGGSIQSVFLLSAIFCSYALYKLLASVKVNIYLPLVLYFGFCYLLAYFIVVRYSLAISFFYIGLVYLFKGNRKSFILTVLVGASFHLFVIFTLPLVVLNRFRLSVTWTITLLLATIVSGFFINAGDYLPSLSLIDGDGFFSKFRSYSSVLSEGFPLTVGLYVIYNVIFVVGVGYFAPRDSEVDILYNSAIWLTLGLVVAIVFVYQIPSVWNRVMLAAVPVQGLALTLIIDRKSFSTRRIIQTISFPIAFAVFILPLIKEDNLFTPYESYFHKVLEISSGLGRQRMTSEF